MSDLLRQAFGLVLTLATPALVAALVLGFLGALLQSMTQLRDPVLSTVPKLLGTLVVLGLASHFMAARLVSFTQALLRALPELARPVTG